MCLVQLLRLVCEFPIKCAEEIPDGRMEAGSLTNTLHSFSLQKVRRVNISLEVVSYRNSMLFALKMKSLFSFPEAV